MTGYGRGEVNGPLGRLTVEVKGVNHRFLEIKVRLPRQLSAVEDRIRKEVSDRLARGQLDVYVNWSPLPGNGRIVKVDKALALAYHSALKELAEAIGSPVEITAETLTHLPDVLTVEEAQVSPDEVWRDLGVALAAALDDLTAMRAREGQALAQDLSQRLDIIRQHVQQIRARAPIMVEEYRQRLQRRLEELLGPATVDPARIAQEVVLYADKSDITEELVRLENHIQKFAETLAYSGNGPAPVGRKLEFILQEMHREINTISNKAADPLISDCVVEVKSQLEKMREQIQNIE